MTKSSITDIINTARREAVKAEHKRNMTQVRVSEALDNSIGTLINNDTIYTILAPLSKKELINLFNKLFGSAEFNNLLVRTAENNSK